MSDHIPGFRSAERAWEDADPYAEDEQCEDGLCDQCLSCLAALAEDEAERYAEGQREDARLEGRR